MTKDYDFEEYCPYCDHINEIVWDGKSKMAICENCYRAIALCSVCENCGDGCSTCKIGTEEVLVYGGIGFISAQECADRFNKPVRAIEQGEEKIYFPETKGETI